MKLRLITLSLIALIILPMGTALAQGPAKFGFKLGMSVSSLDIDNDRADWESRTALAGGGFVAFDLSGIWGLQVEALYVPKGAVTEMIGIDENGESVGDFDLTYQVNYLEIPILVKISLGESPLHLLVGPSIALKMSANIKADDVPTLGGDVDKIDEEWEDIKSSDFCLVFGAGVGLATGFGEVVFDARYTMGLSDIHEGDSVEVKNSGFLITAGVSF